MANLADEARRRLGRVGVWLGAPGMEPADVERDAARRIEAAGYPSLWFSETPRGKEAHAHAALLLAATERLVLATGISGIYSRDASAARSGAEALGEAWPGRFVLGLGVSHLPVVQARGHDYGKPVTEMRRYLDAMADAPYEGPAGDVPVVLAALRDRMLGLAGERTAGAHPYFVPVAHTAHARSVLGDGPLLAPEQAVVLERDPARARAAAREHTAYYLRLDNYKNALRTLGYADDEFADGGSDRLVDDLVAWGDADAIAARVRAHHEAGADHVCIQPVGVDLPTALDTLETLAPALLR